MSDQTQTVQSYVRARKTKVSEEAGDMLPITVLAGAAVIGLAIVYWQVSILLTLLGGAVIALKHITPSQSVEVLEPVAETPVAVEKPKRHYARRLTVNHFQSKTVKV